eukprot:9503050-Pyramimonas_sp.AAC.1
MRQRKRASSSASFTSSRSGLDLALTGNEKWRARNGEQAGVSRASRGRRRELGGRSRTRERHWRQQGKG